MLDILASPDVFPSAFAVLAACYVCLKLAARHWPQRQRPWARLRDEPDRHDHDVRARPPELVELAQRAPSREVQLAAIHSLGQQKRRDALPVLGRLLRSADPLVASEAANSLGAIGDPRALELLQSAADALERELAEALHERPVMPRPTGRSAPPPSQKPWEQIVPPLAKNNFRAFDRYTPHDLKGRPEGELVEMLLEMAANPLEPVATRYHAIKNLELFKHPDIPAKLRQLLSDEHSTLRYAAAETLSIHGNEGCVDALVEKLRDPNRFVRSSAAMTLAVLGSDRAIGPLMKLADDPDDVVRYSVDKALGSIGRKKKIGNLLNRRDRPG